MSDQDSRLHPDASADREGYAPDESPPSGHVVPGWTGQQARVEPAGYTALRRAVNAVRDNGETAWIADPAGTVIAVISPPEQARAESAAARSVPGGRLNSYRVALLFAAVASADPQLRLVMEQLIGNKADAPRIVAQWLREGGS
jgi:hypothetical protein